LKTYSISKKNILKSSKLLDKVFTCGKKISSSTCSLYYLNTKSEEDFRVAFSVGKKTHNLAVNRNKIKRFMREAFRLNREKYGVSSCDMVFVFFDKDIPTYEKVENSIKSLLLSLSKTFES
tara:strand:- start:1650 stop:2012 length:363 start_codon:yes stop_codon:yes gene_type:complete